MSLINRITVWTAGQILKAADLNGEFDNLVNTINNLDSGSTTWDNVVTASLTAQGVTTSSNAISGNLGEYLIATGSTFPASGNYGDVCSLSLTPGDWQAVGTLQISSNGATISGTTIMGVSTVIGNSSGGLAAGISQVTVPLTASASVQYGGTVVTRFSLAVTTIIYLKLTSTYSVATPLVAGGIQAWRFR